MELACLCFLAEQELRARVCVCVLRVCVCVFGCNANSGTDALSSHRLCPICFPFENALERVFIAFTSVVVFTFVSNFVCFPGFPLAHTKLGQNAEGNVFFHQQTKERQISVSGCE